MTGLVQSTLSLIMNACLNVIEDEPTHAMSVSGVNAFYYEESELNDK